MRALTTMACIAALLAGGSMDLRAQPAPRCVPARADVEPWALSRSTGLTLRVPPGFRREPMRSGAGGEMAPTTRWTDSAQSQLVVRRVSTDRERLAVLPSAEGRSEYSRCEERIGSATAEVVSYHRPEGAGGAGAPFQVHARVRWPDGEVIEVYGSAVARARFEQLLAAVRTIRRSAA